MLKICEHLYFLFFLVDSVLNLRSESRIISPEALALSRVPPQCEGNTELLGRICCVVPPFFRKDIAHACGAIFRLDKVDTKQDIAIMTRIQPKGCDFWRCLLNKYGLMVDDDIVDDDKFFNYLDRWTDINPDFSDVMINAKITCKQRFQTGSPLKVCQFMEYQNCLRNYISVDCPRIMNTPECINTKKFFQECKRYFF